jgi:uncharacterized membrane protein
MQTTRLEAFSDGVLAIIITIMVLELKVPHGEGIYALKALAPVFLSYVLSFIVVGIYWNNHHHMMHITKQINGKVLWANLLLLFWLSLLPFVTGWLGENNFASIPMALYGFVLLMSAVSYWILVRAIVASEGADSQLAKAIGSDFKGNISLLIYLVGIFISFYNQWVALCCYVAVACIWFVPDRRIENLLSE